MQRRAVLKSVSGALAGVLLRAQQQNGSPFWRTGSIVPEPAAAGKPHIGKVLAAIQPHADDIPLFAAGTVAKLVNEGYTGYMIRTTNDEKAGESTSILLNASGWPAIDT